jgi:hypothetical protein
VLNRRQIYACRRRDLFFVSSCELEDLLFCETGCQLKMDGEVRFKGARKRRRTRSWTRIKGGIQRRLTGRRK